MSKPLRVLIVEDSMPDAELLLFELRQGGYHLTFSTVETAEAMNEALHKCEWDIVLADYVMPRFGGLAALEALKAKGMDIPFIVVSGAIGEDVAVAAMKAGAHDYLLKGNLTRLVPAVERELREAEVRRQRTKAEAERDRLMEQLRNVNEQVVLRSIRIQEQATEMDTIMAALTEALVVFDSAGEILRLNRAAADLLGYSSVEPEKPLLEQLAQLRLETADRKPLLPQDSPPARALRGETERGLVGIICRGPEAEPVWVSMSAAPIRTADGRPRGGVALFADITGFCRRFGETLPEA
ncbi:MAG: response regulator [Chloroflexi bacterium]|nr:response regulator [Chloroflexota bacterium]